MVASLIIMNVFLMAFVIIMMVYSIHQDREIRGATSHIDHIMECLAAANDERDALAKKLLEISPIYERCAEYEEAVRAAELYEG